MTKEAQPPITTATTTDGFRSWLKNNSFLYFSEATAAIGAIGVVYTAYTRWREVDFGEKYNQLINDIIGYNIWMQIAFLLFAIVALNTRRSRNEQQIFEDDQKFVKRIRYYIGRIPTNTSIDDQEFISNTFPFNNDTDESKAILESKIPKREKDFNDNLLKIRNINEDYFLQYWRAFYYILLILYILFAVVSLMNNKGIIPRLQFAHFTAFDILNRSIEVFLNNLSSTCLLVCFFVCREPLSYNNLNDIYHHRKKGKWKSVFWIGAAISTFAFLLHIFWMIKVSPDSLPFISWDFESKTKTFERLIQADTVVKAISGIYACTTIALLVGRLDDKFARIPSGLVSILFIYAAVQPLFAFFEDNIEIKTIVLFVTLIAKVYFFLIILYMYKTGRLGELLTIFPVVRHIVDRYNPETKAYNNV
jgi:hypothetical protein